jgi:hypothetical protein
MKVYTQHYSPESFTSRMGHLRHLDFSFFLDLQPTERNQLSRYNIIAHQEPNEYTGLHDWIVQNKNRFSLIMTWSDKILNQCKNAFFQPFGSTWLKPEQWNQPLEKKFQVSHVRGNYLRTYGHSLRYEYHARSLTELKIPSKSWITAGIREQPETCAVAKVELFGDSQFGVVIENTSHRGYFTEKIMEMFLLKVIPIYWGCSNIDDFFNPAGIVKFSSVDDIIHFLNSVSPDFYQSRLPAIEENFQRALAFTSYEQNVVDNLTRIFTANGLLSK